MLVRRAITAHALSSHKNCLVGAGSGSTKNRGFGRTNQGLTKVRPAASARRPIRFYDEVSWAWLVGIRVVVMLLHDYPIEEK